MNAEREMSNCPGCKGYSHNPCEFCGYDRQGCEHCDWGRKPGIARCPWCKLALPAQMKLL